jgi:hypothetical protein
MSGEEKTARHERAAVAYAHQLATSAGLIWREITGQDIGIDAVLEMPYADNRRVSEVLTASQEVDTSGAKRLFRCTLGAL